MVDKEINLWPEIENLPQVKSPVTMLREQAALLGSNTKNILLGKVVSAANTAGFTAKLFIEAPAIEYKFELLSIAHNLDMYPVTITFGSKDTQCWAEGEFIDGLAAALKSADTVSVIQALLSQSRAAA